MLHYLAESLCDATNMTSSIVGRISEQQRLQELFDSKAAEFLAVYGRRRVGKTFLIREFFSQKLCEFFQVTGLKDGNNRKQLTLFTNALEKNFYPHLTLSPPSSWMKAFEMLTAAIDQLNTKQKVVIFLDELPWLATKRSDLLSALDHYWNTVWVKNKYIKLIVCGSAASWILKKIIHAKGGLHNRITAIISLQPFNLRDTKQYLQARGILLNTKQIVQLYMVVGGIPYYLNAVQKGLSAMQNINKICFQPNGLLFDEFTKLFSSLFDYAAVYEELIRIIAKNRFGIEGAELIKKARLSSTGGRFTERVTELQQAGFITAYTPPYAKKKGTYYRVIDEYSLFYLTWIETAKKNSVLDTEHHYWEIMSQTPAWKSWSGYAFEAVCFKHISAIKKALGIEHVTLAANAWRYIPERKGAAAGAQIDLIFDRNDGIITLCEIKYCEHEYEIDKATALNLNNKVKVYKEQTKTKKHVFIAFITSSKLKKNSYSSELVSNQVTLDDFFA